MNLPFRFDPERFGEPGDHQLSGLEIRNLIQERYRTHPQNWFRWVYDRLSFAGRPSILEIGCGAGELWRENLDRLPGGQRLILSDLALYMVGAARSGLLDETQDFHFALLDSQKIPFPDDSFDMVIALGLLDLVPDRAKTLDEIQRVLKPGGLFYTSAGSQTHLQEIEELVRPFLPDANYGGSPERFGLENGAALLASRFSEVERFIYENALEFQHMAPLAAYVLSEDEIKAAFSQETLKEFTRFLEQVLSARGYFRVTIKKGIFVARKQPQ